MFGIFYKCVNLILKINENLCETRDISTPNIDILTWWCGCSMEPVERKEQKQWLVSFVLYLFIIGETWYNVDGLHHRPPKPTTDGEVLVGWFAIFRRVWSVCLCLMWPSCLMLRWNNIKFLIMLVIINAPGLIPIWLILTFDIIGWRYTQKNLLLILLYNS